MKSFSVAAAFAALAAPLPALACACGCGVFGVGAGSLIPQTERASIYIENDFMDQNQNWNGTGRAPAGDNDDKEIRTDFITVGGQAMITPTLGVMVEVPIWDRVFKTENDDGTGVDRFHHAALGDIRLMGVWTGLSKDMSTGLTLGVKLPTGDWTYPGFDRDTSIGTGTTDLLFGGYHLGSLDKAERWKWFIQGRAELPLNERSGYRPGQEADAAVGVSYGGIGRDTDRVKFTPLLQLITSVRSKDSGLEADRPNSGYERLLISPGASVTTGKWTLYGDVEVPVYQRTNGNQLVAPVLFKAVMIRSF